MYQLRCSIKGHSSDIRALTVLDNCIITASRDQTVKLWTESGNTYEQTTVLFGHTGYISSVCVLPPNERYPCGLIITGGHDMQIIGYIPYVSEPVLIMQGHTGTVCSLAPSIKDGYFLSSSWDSSAKIWDTSTGQSTISLYGHTQAVWSVIQIPEDFIITGSADKSINVYLSDGTLLRTLFGHTDCVRGLSYAGDFCFFSCANDGTIRKWTAIADICLEIFDAHNDYIYSILADRVQEIIAFVGEKGLLSVWSMQSTTQKQQVISHSATSVWAVAILPNSDIVTGSSDGYIRIYSKDPSKVDSEKSITETSQVDSESLLSDGLYDGEVRFITENGSNYCYTWSEKEKRWSILGENGSNEVKSKPSYNGKKYDYVFNFKIEESKQPLKLPFNKGDNPTDVARNFIIHNNLNPDYLDKIVAFLSENAGLVTPIDAPSTSSSSSAKDVIYESRNYYPPENYVFFEQYDLKLIFNKLKEFMENMNYLPEESHNIQTSLRSLTSGSNDVIEQGIPILINAILTWPEEYVYPVLDIARIACRNRRVHKILLNDENRIQFLHCLDKYLGIENLTNNKMFLFRILSNMFACTEGESLVFDNKDNLMAKLPLLITEKHKGLQVAVCTFLVNMSFAALKRQDFEAIRLCFSFIKSIINIINEPEAMFRMLVALGTIGVVEGSEILNEDIKIILKNVSGWNNSNHVTRKAAICAASILEDLVPVPLGKDGAYI